jgi:hypothetical protein
VAWNRFWTSMAPSVQPAPARRYRTATDPATILMNAEHSVQSIIGATDRRQGLSG